MNYYPTRHDALKAHPGAIVRKLRMACAHVLANAGQYVAFDSPSTYAHWRKLGYVR